MTDPTTRPEMTENSRTRWTVETHWIDGHSQTNIHDTADLALGEINRRAGDPHIHSLVLYAPEPPSINDD